MKGRRRPLTKAELLARMPAALRPKLVQQQLRDLELVHLETLDAIARGGAGEQQLLELVGSTFTWSRAAQLAGIGEAEMALQLDLAARMLERYKRTGRVLFDGPDYQLAKVGQQVMCELARAVDRPTAIAAADWSELQLQRLEDEMRKPLEQAA